MNYLKSKQKLISFSENVADLQKVSEDMKNGWTIINLVKNGNYYVGIMEDTAEQNARTEKTHSVFIPPRKKIKISL